MKATQLSLGNCFMYGDTIVYVSAIFKSHFKCESIDGIDFGNSIQSNFLPIPLSDEWLSKANAVLHPWGWVLNEILIRTNHKDKYWIELGNGKIIELPYVHSLQNFFTLRGEELEFKH